MVIHLLIVSCHFYADEEGFQSERLYPFSYSIICINKHTADGFMAVQTQKYFDSSPNRIKMKTKSLLILTA